jgi:hypothetical protein
LLLLVVVLLVLLLLLAQIPRRPWQCHCQLCACGA